MNIYTYEGGGVRKREREKCELITQTHTNKHTRTHTHTCTHAQAPFVFEHPEGQCFCRTESLMLHTRALLTLADDEVDSDALRAWLPRPDALIHIAQHERMWSFYVSGSAHPAMLGATLYATRLGSWDDAETTVNGILSIPQMCMNPLTRIEALRLLARCRGTRDDAAGACEALESAVKESQTCGYVWMEMMSLRDMLGWVGDGEKASVRARIDAVTAAFAVWDEEETSGTEGRYQQD